MILNIFRVYLKSDYIYIMVKHTRRHKKKSIKMRGGANRQQLENLGFQKDEIDYLTSYADKKRIDIIPTIQAFLGQGMSHSKIVEEMQEGEDTTIESPYSFDSNAMGKKKRKSKKSKKNNRRTIRRRNLRGGTCYGSGVGANNYDPNFSIYNTRELQLFPYKPN
jgi:hypothetical protein